VKKTKKIKLGNVEIGGGAPVSIQSMTNTDTGDALATLAQINTLFDAGCEIIRVAVPDRKAIDALPEIIEKSQIPVIADIHFDHRLALGAIAAGIHGIRINPGNIGDQAKVIEVAEAAATTGVPIRVGANSGSLPAGMYENELKDKTPQDAMAISLVKSAFQQCQLLEKCGFDQIKVSLKSPDVPVMVKAYRMFASRSDYPLHIGVTEAGTLTRGTVKSAIGIGALLLDGIGDTLRVSLTADPVEEIKTAILILETVGLRTAHPEIISCPTCGRTEFDLFALVDKIEQEITTIKKSGIKLNIKKVAVMGCVVNGPGEAKDAELGIAGVKGGKASVFLHGESIGTFPEQEALNIFKEKLLGFKYESA
jgi:(E)-4-hydroxy-3-methylbut-2-enyl-diphosphate synthase